MCSLARVLRRGSCLFTGSGALPVKVDSVLGAGCSTISLRRTPDRGHCSSGGRGSEPKGGGGVNRRGNIGSRGATGRFKLAPGSGLNGPGGSGQRETIFVRRSCLDPSSPGVRPGPTRRPPASGLNKAGGRGGGPTVTR